MCKTGLKKEMMMVQRLFDKKTPNPFEKQFILPGTKPHSVISSSAVANRVFLPLKCSLTFLESIFLLALRTNKCSLLSTRMRMALPPIDRSSPRALADSSDVSVGACSTRLKLFPAVSNKWQMPS